MKRWQHSDPRIKVQSAKRTSGGGATRSGHAADRVAHPDVDVGGRESRSVPAVGKAWGRRTEKRKSRHCKTRRSKFDPAPESPPPTPFESSMKTGIIRRVGSGSDPHDTAGICARKARLNVVLVAEFWNGGVDDIPTTKRTTVTLSGTALAHESDEKNRY